MTPLDRFDCEEAFRRLGDFVDRELSAEEMTQVQAHLAVCQSCALEFNFEASVLQCVKRKVRQIDVPAGFQARLLAALRSPNDP